MRGQAQLAGPPSTGFCGALWLLRRGAMCGRETLDGGQAHQLLDRDNAQVCGSSGQRQLCAVDKPLPFGP